MPRFPTTSGAAEGIPASTFEAFATKLKQKSAEDDFAPLHLGDTYPLPPEPARRLDWDDADLHRYGPITGPPTLREASAADLTARGLPVSAADVFITPGATGGLDLAVNAALSAGDEALVLTPSWPLILGVLQRHGCTPIQVDVDPSGVLPADPAALRAVIEAARTERTCAIYLCNPNNPAGFVYSPAHLAVIADLAEAHGWWILYDAVYADMSWGQEQHLAFAAQPGVRERTCVVTSYSKAFGLAGQRVGVLVAPPALQHLIPRLQTHSTYHGARIGQAMALACLQNDPAGARAVRVEIARTGATLVAEHLTGVVPFAPAQAGAFVLLDLRALAPDDAGGLAVLDRALDASVSLAPGIAFGERFGRFARLCYTACPPERLVSGLERLKDVLRA